jgi:arylsulfatase A-like enzyme
VTSDHGEDFMENELYVHGLGLYDTFIYIPLIIKMPKSYKTTAKRISKISDLVDLMPTVLDVLGISFNGQMQGESLVPLMLNKKNNGKNRIFASLNSRKKEKKRTVRTFEWKYTIFDMDFSEQDEFFRIKDDKREQNNLLSQGDENKQRLKIYLTDHIRECMNLFGLKYSQNRKIDRNYPERLRKKHLEALRAFGYIR